MADLQELTQQEFDPATAATAGSPGVRRYSTREFLATLVLFIVAAPFVEKLDPSARLNSLLFTVVLLSAVFAVGARRRTLFLAILLVLPAVLTKWADHVAPHSVPPEIFWVTGIVFCLFVVAQLLRFVIAAPRVDSQVIYAAVAVYLMIGIIWALAYILVGHLDPAAFLYGGAISTDHVLKGFEAIYFSFVTLSTSGYGDIVPASGVARMLAIMEQTVGIFYVAVLVARLVSAYTPARRSDGQGR